MKKEKKDAITPENNDLAEIKKDYQQEEDKDVKEKSKTKKLIIAISLFVVIFFVILLIWYVKDHSVKETAYKVDGEQAAPVIAQADEQTGSEQVTLNGATVDLSGTTAEVTIPLEYFGEEQPADTLSDSQLKNGYTAVKKDGENIVYTIKTSYFVSVVNNLYEYNEQLFDKEYEEKNGIELVSSNRQMTVFTITVDKDGFKADKHYDMLEYLYYKAAIYQCYYGVAPQDISVTFQFKYTRDQFPFADYQFPSSLGQKLSDITKPSETQSTSGNQNAAN